jgi:hypothetical protein
VDSRQFRIIAALLGVIGVGLLVLILVLVFSNGGDEDPAAAPTTVVPTLPPVTLPQPTSPSTTLPQPTSPPTTLPGPTLPPATTAAPPPATTAAPPPATTAAPPPPTTEAPPPPLVLQDDGIGGVVFGTDPNTVIAYAESQLGAADLDTGWIDSFSKYGTCPGSLVRGVEWQTEGGGIGFALLFTQVVTDHRPGGGPHLFGYYYFGTPAGLMTEGGITVGSTLGDALSAHPGSTVDEHPLVVGSGIWTLDEVEDDDSLLWGFADGTANSDTLSSINGGVTCGE